MSHLLLQDGSALLLQDGGGILIDTPAVPTARGFGRKTTVLVGKGRTRTQRS